MIFVIRFGWRLWVRERRISLRAVLIFEDSRIPVRYLEESWLGSVNFCTSSFIIRHIICCVTSCNFNFLSVTFPFCIVFFSPYFLFFPSFDTIGVRFWWHIYHYAWGIPDLILEARVFPHRRLARPLTNGRVIFAISVINVDFDDISVF